MANKEVQPTMEDLLKHVADQKDIQIGEKIKGKIIYIAKNEVTVDIQNVGLGIVRGRELYNEEYLSSLEIGQEVEAIVIELDNEKGIMELSFRAIGRDKIWSDIKKAFEDKQTVEAKIRDVNRGGFLVRVRGIYGFLPASLLAPTHAIKQGKIDSKSLVNQMKKYVGQTFNVKILTLNEENDSIIVSEKEVADEIAVAKLSKYKVNDVVEGSVVGIVDFGLFVRFDDNLEGLVHISELSWKKIEKPQDEFKMGDSVNAKIIDIDENNRINLSIKQTLPNPWVLFAKKTNVGDSFSGKITKIISYGVIATNDDDIQGLCHITHIANEVLESPAQIHDLLKIGEVRDFNIISVDEDEKLYLTLLPIKDALKREEENKKRKEEEEKVKTDAIEQAIEELSKK